MLLTKGGLRRRERGDGEGGVGGVREAGGRQLSQAGKRGDEAGRRPPVEYGVMQFALTRTRLGGWGASAREGEAAAERGRSRPGVEAAEGTGRQAPSDSDKLLLENGNK